MNRIFIIVLLAVFSLAGCLQRFKGPDISSISNKHLDLAYAELSERQKLDIFLPEQTTSPVPLIISVHGGAFMFGDKRDHQLSPMLLGLKRGYGVASVNYRYSEEARFPAQIHDIKAAIRYLRAHATEFNLDPERFAIWGGSAGGYLASLAGVSHGIAELEDLNLGNPETSSELQAVVDWFGPINFASMDAQFKESGKGAPNHGEATSPEGKLLGAALAEVPELVMKANPETYISPDDPPFFIQHGMEDNMVPVQQSIEFAQNLREVLPEHKIELHLLEEAGHGGEAFLTGKNLEKVFGFLDRALHTQ